MDDALVLIAEYRDRLVTVVPYKGYKRFAVLTVVSVFLVILAGGVVRTTGSGMGCPDWPKCFGLIIPPTEESQLPSDYKTRYMVKGHLAEFNVQKTWIEYINRLIGALSGVFILVAFALSLRFKEDRQVAVYSGLGLVLVLFEGILGKLTVDEHLKPVVVSLHFWGAVAVIVCILYAVTRLFKKDYIDPSWKPLKSTAFWIIGLLVLTAVHMFIGSQVRQWVDHYTFSNFSRAEIIELLKDKHVVFTVHRLMSYVLMGAAFYIFWKLLAHAPRPVHNIKVFLTSLLLIEFIGGLIMAEFNLPSWVQPLHMLASTVFISFLFQLYWVVNFNINHRENQ
ncbi:MAG: COX15/CtaA family protein [Cytophagaceae bacterium]|nr:COX15/CtaA family protein [Cytophagaceae bacterium]